MIARGKSSVEFSKVFLRSSAAISGPKEKKGPLGEFFDYSYDDPYCRTENWEQAEIQLQKDAMQLALKKIGLEFTDIRVVVGGDLNNQLAITNYALRDFDVPYLGVYSACSTCTQSIALASMLVDSGYGENILTITSSHNSTSERQFRYPTEYGGQKPYSDWSWCCYHFKYSLSNQNYKGNNRQNSRSKSFGYTRYGTNNGSCCSNDIKTTFRRFSN